MEEKEQSQEISNTDEQNISDENLADQWEQALSKQGDTDESVTSDESDSNKSEETSASDVMADWSQAFEEQESVSQSASCPEMEKMELFSDIPVEISVEIGSASMKLEEVLNIHPNSIVELDRYINEPVDIKVNGKLVAKGELYVVEDQYGIKITQIITPEERLKLIEDEY